MLCRHIYLRKVSITIFHHYFYRMFSYLTNFSFKEIYYLISSSYLVDNYDVLHSLPINESIKETIENKNIKVITKEGIFIKNINTRLEKCNNLVKKRLEKCKNNSIIWLEKCNE